MHAGSPTRCWSTSSSSRCPDARDGVLCVRLGCEPPRRHLHGVYGCRPQAADVGSGWVRRGRSGSSRVEDRTHAERAIRRVVIDRSAPEPVAVGVNKHAPGRDGVGEAGIDPPRRCRWCRLRLYGPYGRRRLWGRLQGEGSRGSRPRSQDEHARSHRTVMGAPLVGLGRAQRGASRTAIQVLYKRPHRCFVNLILRSIRLYDRPAS